jgi:hypothetical protein
MKVVHDNALQTRTSEGYVPAYDHYLAPVAARPDFSSGLHHSSPGFL